MDVDEVSSRINAELCARLSMVLPYVASRRWHKGMAIGALPQNALGTLWRLDHMADIVLAHVLGGDHSESGGWGRARRAAIVAAYAAVKLHFLSGSGSGGAGSAAPSSSRSYLSREGHRDTWTFLGARSAKAVCLVVTGIPSPDPGVVAMASAAFSS